jgi:hypothetical protein
VAIVTMKPPEPRQLALHGKARQAVQLAQRLVQDQQPGIIDERTCE